MTGVPDAYAGTPPVRVGIDVGGTFTDFQIFDARTGAISSFKTLTTPDDPSIGLMTGLKAGGPAQGFALADIGYLLHGTTIATNAVLERKLAKGALVTTARFEDVIEIGRHYRREIYSLNPRVPPTLIPRDRRIGIEERIRADGTVETPLTTAAIERAHPEAGRAGRGHGRDLPAQFVSEPATRERDRRGDRKTRPALKVSCSSALIPKSANTSARRRRSSTHC